MCWKINLFFLPLFAKVPNPIAKGNGTNCQLENVAAGAAHELDSKISGMLLFMHH